MLPRQELPDPLQRLLVVQDGAVSRQQALQAGLSHAARRRLVDSGRWRCVAEGVYVVGVDEPTWPQLASAAVLLGGEGARLAGRSAAHLHRLLDDAPQPLDVLAPRNVTDRAWVTFRRERPGPRRVSSAAWPPRLDVPDTVLDLCGAGSPADVVHWVTAAVQRRRTTPVLLERRLAARGRIPHRRLIADLVADAGDGVHSNLEHRFLHDVERAHGLPRGRRQFVVPGSGKVADVAYEEFALLVELDGVKWHGAPADRWRDRRRDNVHSNRWTTYRYGWQDVSGHACAVAAELAGAMVSRGWVGVMTRCARCVPDLSE